MPSSMASDALGLSRLPPAILARELRDMHAQPVGARPAPARCTNIGNRIEPRRPAPGTCLQDVRLEVRQASPVLSATKASGLPASVRWSAAWRHDMAASGVPS